MRFASLLLLMVLPGSWLAFCPGSAHLSYSSRFAMAIVLAPPVAAVQFFILRLAGLTFQQVVPALQLVNLGAIVLIIRAFGQRRPRVNGRRILFGAGVYASVAASVAVPWLWDPNFRRYSWHGLLHTDIVYAFARGAVLPEEPELAGVSLTYPWIGHVYWSLLAWSVDVSPTVIYLVSNLALLGATGALYYSLARELGASELTSFATPVVLALGTNLIGLIGWSVIQPNDNGIWWAILGDLRYAPFLLKFVTFETMTFGLSLYTALVVLCVSALRKHEKLELYLIPVMVTATAALYPNLFPASVLLVGGLIATFFIGGPYIGGRYMDGHYTVKQLLGLVLLSLVAVVAGLLIIKLYSIGRVNGILKISSVPAFAKKSLAATLALGPFAAAMYWLWKSEPAQRRAPLLALAFGATGAVALNVLLRIGALDEYKFVMAAGICLAAPATIGFERTFLRNRQDRWKIPVLCPLLLLFMVMVSYSVNRIPNRGSKPLDASEGSFWLTLAPDNPDAIWIDAIRKNTPPTTVVVVNHPEFHTTSFTGRSLIVPSEGTRYHFGYNVASKPNMLLLRGYSSELFEERYKLLERIYAAEVVEDMNPVLQQLMLLRRPLAIVFGPSDGRAFFKWLRANRIGTELFNDKSGRAVYLIRP